MAGIMNDIGIKWRVAKQHASHPREIYSLAGQKRSQLILDQEIKGKAGPKI